MKKTLAKSVATAAAAALLVAGAPAGMANAAPSPVLGVELGVNLDKVVAVDATYNLASSRLSGIPAIKQLRAEMWETNPKFDGTSLREAAAKANLTTKVAYVNAVNSDLNLAYSALQRAAENRGNRLSHDRPIVAADCTLSDRCGEIWTATHNGVGFFGENLSFDETANAVLKTRDELAALNANNGYYQMDRNKPANGHLHNVLNPKMTAYGVSTVHTKQPSGRITYTALLASYILSATDNLPDKVEHKYLYRAAAPGEKPTGVLTTEPPADSVLPNLPGSTDLSGSLNTGSLGNGENGIAGSLQSLTGGAGSADGALTAQLLQFGITAAVFIGLSALANGVVVHF